MLGSLFFSPLALGFTVLTPASKGFQQLALLIAARVGELCMRGDFHCISFQFSCDGERVCACGHPAP